MVRIPEKIETETIREFNRVFRKRVYLQCRQCKKKIIIRSAIRESKTTRHLWILNPIELLWDYVPKVNAQKQIYCDCGNSLGYVIKTEEKWAILKKSVRFYF